MKTILNMSALAVLLLVVPSPCFALWFHQTVSKERAKELGMAVRSAADGPNQVRVELEFKTEGKLERFIPGGKFEGWSGVELQVGEGKNPLVTAPLLEDRSKPGRVVVRFTRDRAQLEQLKLRVFVAESDGGTIYELAVKDFVELKRDPDSPPVPAGEPQDGQLKKLLSERLAALRVLVKLTTDDYQAGKSSLDRVFQAQRALLDAQLELCESDKERIAVLEENVALAKEYEKFAVQRYQKASAMQSDVIMAQADRLAAEIALERAKAKTPAKPK